MTTTSPTARSSAVTRPTRPARRRTSAWVLIGTFAVYLAYLAAAATALPGENSSDYSAAQLAAIAGPWVLVNLLWSVPILLGAAAFVPLARSTGPGPLGRAVIVLETLAAAAIVAYAVLMLTLFGFTEPTLGDVARHDVASLLSLAASWLSLVSTGLLALALRRAGLLRAAGLVFAILSGVYLLLDAVTWIPVLTGAVPVAEGGGLPPALLGALWLAFGIVLLRRRVSSEA